MFWMRARGRGRRTYYYRNKSERSDQRRGLPATRTRVAQLRIQDGEHPAFEFLAPRHCQRNRRRRVASHARDDVQQMLGIVGRARATGECEIVARALALGTQLL